MQKKYLIIAIILLIIISFVTLVVFLIHSTTFTSWHLNYMNVNMLWDYTRGNTQTIAFLDTGISSDVYNAYIDRIISSWNVIDDNDDVDDKHGHGTEMVSVACGDGYKDIFGIAPECKIIIVKAVSDEGKTNNEYLYDGLIYARDNGATIVNISLGGFKTDENVVNLIQEMISDGITIVASAGDYGNKDLLFPASVPNVISVEALDENLNLWSNSNYSQLSVVRAPGVNIETLTIVNNEPTKELATGTSQATAVTSGYIALLRDYASRNKVTLSNDKIISILSLLHSKEKGTQSNYVSALKSTSP